MQSVSLRAHGMAISIHVSKEVWVIAHEGTGRKSRGEGRSSRLASIQTMSSFTFARIPSSPTLIHRRRAASVVETS